MSNNLNATHSFLPWARRGLAGQITEVEIFDGINPPPTGGADERATIVADVHIKDKANLAVTGSPVSMNFQIIGPGDIIGIHQDAIVKTEPLNWITNFEPHSFPFIDFYEEDFPWRYTPAKPNPVTNSKKLRPWITLVVLKEDEFDRVTKEGAPLNVIALKTNIQPNERPLPKNDELWAWAHVSVNTELDENGTTLQNRIAKLNEKVNAEPSVAISRIICPRKLEENTSYYAFLIPTYETGRLAGLGLPTTSIKAQAPAWDHVNSWVTPPQSIPQEPGKFPVYHEWYFRTGATGDFEYLVRQVKPRIADLRVGKRLMDIQAPGYGLTYTATPPSSQPGAEWLEGALIVPGNNAAQFVEPVPPNPQTPENVFSDKIKNFINLGEDVLTLPISNPLHQSGFPLPSDPLPAVDPIVTPPLYGRWHALRNKADRYNNPNLWLNELNLDPRYRVAASLGGDYVRKNQELLMDEAWDQVGAVMKANRDAALAQLAMETSMAMHAKHISSQSIEQLLPMTSNVHGRIMAGANTLRQATVDSSLPESASSSAFRKISRPTGVLVQRMNPASTFSSDTMGDMIQGVLAPVANKQAPGPMASTFHMTLLDSAISNLQSVPNPSTVAFNISLPAGPPSPPNATVATNFHSSFTPFTGVFDSVNWLPPSSPPNLNTTPNVIVDGIDPFATHPRSFYASISVNQQQYVPPTPGAIVPVMAAPQFKLPMYESLKALGQDYLIPNLNLIPQNSMTVLESNQKFIEAFLAGANYEMGRELLWREYPTDQRGTYFRFFWNSIDNPNLDETNTPDIRPIHTWLSNTQLGTHSGRTGTGSNNLVLAIRGDFLKKFPNAIIFAVEAEWQYDPINPAIPLYNAQREIKLNAQNEEIRKFPIFSAKIEPDITFLGFDITKEQAKGSRTPVPQQPPLPDLDPTPGWFFVIMERPGELRFGLDEPLTPPVPLLTWADLTWADVDQNDAGYLNLTPDPQFSTNPAPPIYSKWFDPINEDVDWAEDSTAMAQILYQSPVKVLIHANEMIP